jgi:hypothetical protein
MTAARLLIPFLLVGIAPAYAADYAGTYAKFVLAAQSKQMTQHAAAILASESTEDSDGFSLPPAMLNGSGGPTGGGRIPLSSAAPRTDGTVQLLGYCAWDNGPLTSASGRIAGSNSLAAPTLAVIAPGNDGVFNTTCAQLAAGNPAQGDDQVKVYSTAQIRSMYSLHVGAAVADATALTSVSATARDGELRLQKSDNTLHRWDAGSGAWATVGSSGSGAPGGGSSAEPGYSFSGASGTGIYGSAGALGFSVGGASIMTLDSTGLTVNGQISATSDVAVGGNLTVAGTTTLTGALTANGGIATSSLASSGNATIGGTLTTTGLHTANGGIATSALTTSGAATINGLLTANGGVAATTLSASGNAGVGGALAVTGYSSLNSGAAVSSGSGLATALQVLPTWNNAGTTYNGLLVNVVNTASDANSKLLDLQVAGTSKFSVNAAGNVVAPSLQLTPGTLPTGSAGQLAYQSSDNKLYYYNGTAWTAAGAGPGLIADGANNLLSSNSTWAGSGNTNLALGYRALANAGTASSNIALGSYSLQYSQDGSQYNIAIGSSAAKGSASVGGGSYNTALGVSAMESGLVGSYNLAVGHAAMQFITGASSINSVAMGRESIGGTNLNAAGQTSYDVAIGYRALKGVNSASARNTSYNVAIGADAMRDTLTGTNSSAIGSGALAYNSTGSNNSAIGYHAGLSNSAGAHTSSYLTLLGTDTSATLASSSAVAYATAVGAGATVSTINTVALGRTTDTTVIGATGSTGSAAKLQVTGGLQLVGGTLPTGAAGVVAYQSSDNKLYYHNGTAWTAVSSGTALGPDIADNLIASNSGWTGTIGTGSNATNGITENIIFGLQAGQRIGGSGAVWAHDNFAVGAAALRGSATQSANTGAYNAAIGYGALMGNTSGTANVAIGPTTLFSNTSGGSNIAIGGVYGGGALYSNLTGTNNIAMGQYAMNINTAGSQNIALGLHAGYGIKSNDNVAIGNGAMSASSNITGAGNTAVGLQAGYVLSSGANNSALGTNSLIYVSSGSKNVGVGYNAGFANSGQSNTSSYVTLVGADSSANLTGSSATAYATAIGAGAVVSTPSTVALGRTTDITVIGATGADTANAGYGMLQVTGHITPGADNAYNLGSSLRRWNTVYAGNGTIQTSDARLKKNVIAVDPAEAIRIVTAMAPVRYNWMDGTPGRKLGFLAQDLVAVLPEVVHLPESSNDFYGVNYAEISALLTAALKGHEQKLAVLTATTDKAGTTTLKVNGKLEADVIKARQVEAELVKTKKLEADKVEAGKVVSGELEYASNGSCQPLFTLGVGAVYDVKVVSVDTGGWGSLRVSTSNAAAFVQDQKVSELNPVSVQVVGNQVCALSSGRVNRASWLRVL